MSDICGGSGGSLFFQIQVKVSVTYFHSLLRRFSSSFISTFHQRNQSVQQKLLSVCLSPSNKDFHNANSEYDSVMLHLLGDACSLQRVPCLVFSSAPYSDVLHSGMFHLLHTAITVSCFSHFGYCTQDVLIDVSGISSED